MSEQQGFWFIGPDGVVWRYAEGVLFAHHNSPLFVADSGSLWRITAAGVERIEPEAA